MSTPDLFTLAEAAAVLRIGRTTAYELARRDLATNGGEGLGVVRIGGQLRVPRASLERLIGAPIATREELGEAPPPPSPIRHATSAGLGPAEPGRSAPHEPVLSARRRTRVSDETAPTLPFPS